MDMKYANNIMPSRKDTLSVIYVNFVSEIAHQIESFAKSIFWNAVWSIFEGWLVFCTRIWLFTFLTIQLIFSFFLFLLGKHGIVSISEQTNINMFKHLRETDIDAT